MDLSKATTNKTIPDLPLWREEVFTDGGLVTIRVRHPVTKSGQPDTSRTSEFIGETLCNMGLPHPIPVSFKIEGAATLEDARGRYQECLEKAAGEAHRKVQQALLDARRQIVTAESIPPRGDGKILRS